MNTDTLFKTIFKEIIQEQSAVVGEDLALYRASIAGISFDGNNHDVIFKSNPAKTIVDLVKSYEDIFGRASVEVCMSVINRYPKKELAGILPKEYLL